MTFLLNSVKSSLVELTKSLPAMMLTSWDSSSSPPKCRARPVAPSTLFASGVRVMVKSLSSSLKATGATKDLINSARSGSKTQSSRSRLSSPDWLCLCRFCLSGRLENYRIDDWPGIWLASNVSVCVDPWACCHRLRWWSWGGWSRPQLPEECYWKKHLNAAVCNRPRQCPWNLAGTFESILNAKQSSCAFAESSPDKVRTLSEIAAAFRAREVDSGE